MGYRFRCAYRRKPTPPEQKLRETVSKAANCKAEIRLLYANPDEVDEDDPLLTVSTVRTDHSSHNNATTDTEPGTESPSSSFSPATEEFVSQSIAAHCGTGFILTAVRALEGSNRTAQDVGNLRRRLANEMKFKDDANTFINSLLQAQSTLSLMVDYKTQAGSLERVSWMYKDALSIGLRFKEVWGMDATYKLTLFDLKLVIVGARTNQATWVPIFHALITHETTESYEWVLKSLIKAFNGAPKVMITDGSAAEAAAISSVCNSTTHRLCSWHISENIAKNFKKIDEVDINKIRELYWRAVKLRGDENNLDHFWKKEVQKLENDLNIEENDRVEWDDDTCEEESLWSEKICDLYSKIKRCSHATAPRTSFFTLATSGSEALNSAVKSSSAYKAKSLMGLELLTKQSFTSCFSNYLKEEEKSAALLDRPIIPALESLRGKISRYALTFVGRHGYAADFFKAEKTENHWKVSAIGAAEKNSETPYLSYYDCYVSIQICSAQDPTIFELENCVCTCRVPTVMGLPCAHVLTAMRAFGNEISKRPKVTTKGLDTHWLLRKMTLIEPDSVMYSKCLERLARLEEISAHAEEGDLEDETERVSRVANMDTVEDEQQEATRIHEEDLRSRSLFAEFGPIVQIAKGNLFATRYVEGELRKLLAYIKTTYVRDATEDPNTIVYDPPRRFGRRRESHLYVSNKSRSRRKRRRTEPSQKEREQLEDAYADLYVRELLVGDATVSLAAISSLLPGFPMSVDPEFKHLMRDLATRSECPSQLQPPSAQIESTDDVASGSEDDSTCVPKEIISHTLTNTSITVAGSRIDYVRHVFETRWTGYDDDDTSEQPSFSFFDSPQHDLSLNTQFLFYLAKNDIYSN